MNFEIFNRSQTYRLYFLTFPRVDIHRKDNAHSLKKEITVFGSAEVCNQAIAMILQIMQDERATLSKVSRIFFCICNIDL